MREEEPQEKEQSSTNSEAGLYLFNASWGQGGTGAVVRSHT